MSLESDLQAIWQKYEPQRQAEKDMMETARTAARELAELNVRRISLGLGMVSEPRDPTSTLAGLVSQATWTTPPKTWRDDLDQAILVTVKKHFQEPA